MATAEFAVAIPAVLFVMVLALSALSAGADQLRCIDAARATARAMARGDAQGRAVAQGRRLGPRGAAIEVSMSSAQVEVTVRSRPAALLAWVAPSLGPSAHAVAAREDAAVDAVP